MRRWIGLAILFGVLGGMMTWGVSWACARWVDVPVDIKRMRTGPAERGWIVSVYHGPGATRVSTTPDNGEWILKTRGVFEIPPWSRANELPSLEEFEDPRLPSTIEYAYGWPWRSMLVVSRTQVYSTAGVGVPIREQSVSGVAWRDTMLPWTAPARLLPMRILPAGFVLNSVLYGLMLWLLWLTPGVVRARVRMWRGACPRCGYDLRSSSLGADASCPECGDCRRRDGTFVMHRR
jgi:hypothetical protein